MSSCPFYKVNKSTLNEECHANHNKPLPDTVEQGIVCCWEYETCPYYCKAKTKEQKRAKQLTLFEVAYV